MRVTRVPPGGGSLFASERAILWKHTDPGGSFSGQLAGVLLPSLRRVTIALPASIQSQGIWLALLDNQRLYVADETGVLSVGPAPN